MRVDVVTIFPDYLAPARLSLVGQAIERGDIRLAVHDLREAADDRHRTVDDAPFGGGPGMVMTPEPWARTLEPLLAEGVPGTRIVVPTPSGRPFTQRTAQQYADAGGRLIIACGRYEGIDARVWEFARRSAPVDEVSIGDYVLAGGEVAALVILEAVARLLPGVLGNDRSAADDSFTRDAADGLLEGPVYTRPRVWRGLAVPDVLLSGDHARIQQWRADQSRARTVAQRPDLV